MALNEFGEFVGSLLDEEGNIKINGLLCEGEVVFAYTSPLLPRLISLEEIISLYEISSIGKNLIIGESSSISDAIFKGRVLFLEDTVSSIDFSLSCILKSVFENVSVFEQIGLRKGLLIDDTSIIQELIASDKSLLSHENFLINDFSLIGKTTSIYDLINFLEQSIKHRFSFLGDNVFSSDVIGLLRSLFLQEGISLQEFVYKGFFNIVFIEDTVNISTFAGLFKELNIEDELSFLELLIQDKEISVNDIIAISIFILIQKNLSLFENIQSLDISEKERLFNLIENIDIEEFLLCDKALVFEEEIPIDEKTLVGKLLNIFERAGLREIIIRSRMFKVGEDIILVELPFFEKIKALKPILLPVKVKLRMDKGKYKLGVAETGYKLGVAVAGYELGIAEIDYKLMLAGVKYKLMIRGKGE